MKMPNIQLVKWIDEKLQAEVMCEGKVARVIQYRDKNEYDACKNVYYSMGGKKCDE